MGKIDVPENCEECGRYKLALTKFMRMYGDTPCDVLFVGEAPGKTEDRMGRPFWPTAPSGKLLEKVCRTVGLDQFRRAYTNGVRCWSPDPQNPKKQNKIPTPLEIASCRRYLFEDIEYSQPKLVVLLGAIALRAGLGQGNITRNRGAVVEKDGVVFLSSYHPSYVLRDPRYEKDLVSDMQQAKLLLEQMIGERTVIDRLKEKYHYIDTDEKLDWMIGVAMTRESLGFDTEFHPLDCVEERRVCYGVTIAWLNDDGTTMSCFVPVDHTSSPFFQHDGVKKKLRALLLAKPLDTHNAEADVETALECFDIHPKDIRVSFDSMAASLALHGPASSHALKTLIMTEAPEIAGYDQELNQFKDESAKHIATLVRWIYISEQLQKFEEKRQRQLEKHPTKTPKPYKRVEELLAERIELQPALKEAIDFIETWKTVYDGEDYGTIPLPILSIPYGAGDGDAAIQLKRKYIPRIKKTNQERFFYKVLNRSWRLNLEMRRNGLLLDWDQWRMRFEYYTGESARLLRTIRNLPDVIPYVREIEANGKEFSLHPSSNDLPKLMFTVLKLPPPSYKTDSGSRWALDKNALLEIKAQRAHPIIDLLLEKSSIDKMLSTYVEGWTQHTNKKGNRVLYLDGRVHPRFHNFTESTRRGTSAPNTQNSPAGDPKSPYARALRRNLEANHPQRPDEDKKRYDARIDKLLQPLLPDNMRMIIRAAPKYLFCQSDFGQLEFRLAACYSGDDAMIEGCRKGDPHGAVQQRFKIKIIDGETVLDPDGEPLPRVAAKRINFGIIYGCEAPRLQEIILEECGLKWSLEFCQEIIDGMWKLYPKLKAWIDETHAFIREHGYIRNALGKIRWLPHAQRSDDKYVAERACREGLNDTCQSLGHNLLDIVMNELLDFIWANGLDWRICNDQHDGFLMEAPADEIEEACRMAKHFMESIPPRVLGKWLQVPLSAEIKRGQNWGDLEEWKEAA